ncbi:helix-turn-helix domain-containing protein [Enterobacter bugandensis]|uniref:helix-turn-helix domain-containing protein n=1 Tax=Enterobacter bugandensis TaxID=881260 RepID=UPI0022E2C85B|nr:helix-turn-helix transcriptional regulator [Enterobacter bugandensis]
MPIVINLTSILKSRDLSARDLAKAIDITEANISILKNGHAKAIRFSTLEKICRFLDCTPGDIIEYIDN